MAALTQLAGTSRRLPAGAAASFQWPSGLRGVATAMAGLVVAGPGGWTAEVRTEKA